MSVVVLGMEMPDNCEDCFAYWRNAYCTISNVQKGRKDMQNLCPLRPLPEKHGRLIDADALMRDVRKNSESYFADDFAHQWVDYPPTIIEAEGENDGAIH